jgi:diguanylate cyclase (GGDEF)-like protein
VQALLAAPRLSRFNPQLERAFQTHQSDRFSRMAERLVVSGGIGTAFAWVLDLIYMSESAVRTGIFRLMIIALFVVAWRSVARRWPTHWQFAAIAAAIFGLIGGSALIGHAIGPVHEERYVTEALIGSFAAVIVPVLPLRWSMSLMLGSVLFGNALLLGVAGRSLTDQADLLIILPLLSLAFVIARIELEELQRRGFLMALRDEARVAELSAANASLFELSSRDPLTGLLNRRHFDDLAAVAWAEAATRRGWFSLFMLDLDHFKSLNDAAGHAEGDRCLELFARAVQAHIRADSDLAGRYGGEEFVVALPGADPATALSIAERVRAATLSLAFPNPGRPACENVTVSIGVASGRASPGVTVAEAQLQADIALYQAKQTGRNRVHQVRLG